MGASRRGRTITRSASSDRGQLGGKAGDSGCIGEFIGGRGALARVPAESRGSRPFWDAACDIGRSPRIEGRAPSRHAERTLAALSVPHEAKQAHAPAVSMRQEIAQAMRDIFSQPGVEEAREMAKKVIKRYEKKAPKFAKWLEENIEEGFTIFKLPRPLWRKLRTSNGLERLNREIKRRTRVATLFPNEASCLRLITAVLQEINEEWVTGRSYIGTAATE